MPHANASRQHLFQGGILTVVIGTLQAADNVAKGPTACSLAAIAFTSRFRAFRVVARLPAGLPLVMPNRASTSASGNDVPPTRRSRIIRQKSAELASARSSAS